MTAGIMATAYIENAETDLSCSLCMELFVDPHTPKQLDCPHVYCQVCLTELVRGGVPVITCPDCRTTTHVPPKTPNSEGGVATLRTSIRLRSLAENHQKHAEKLKSSKDHEQSDVPQCQVHDGERLHFYCLTCKVLVCQACGFLDHDKSIHDIKGVKTVHQEKNQSIQRKIEAGVYEVTRLEQMTNSISEVERQIKMSAASTEADIDKAVKDAITQVKQNGETMKSRLPGLTEKQLDVYRSKQDELKKEERSFDNMKKYFLQLSDTTPYHGVIKLAQLEEEFEKFNLSNNLMSQSVSHMTTSYRMVSNEIGELGQLERVSTTPACKAREMKLTQTVDVKGLQASESVTIAGRNDTLAICQLGRVFICRRQHTGKYKHTLILDKEDAVGVAVTADGKFLVASKTSVEVFNSEGEYQSMFCQANDGFHSMFYPAKHGVETIRNVAVLSDGKIIVCKLKKSPYSQRWSSIAMYNDDGTKGKTIYLNHVPHSLITMKGSQVAWFESYQPWNILKYNHFKCKVCMWDVNAEKEIQKIPNLTAESMCYDAETDCLMIGIVDSCSWAQGNFGKIGQYRLNPLTLVSTICIDTVAPIAMTFANANDLVVDLAGRDMHQVQVFTEVHRG